MEEPKVKKLSDLLMQSMERMDDAIAADYPKSGDWPGYAPVESVAEEWMLDFLYKYYLNTEIELQARVDRYRVDFVTADNVGWEVDGSQFHERPKDEIRDRWILSNSSISKIVRVPAAALWHFPNATATVISYFVDRLERARNRCRMNGTDARKEMDRWKGYTLDIGIAEFKQFQFLECYEVFPENHIGFVGSPLAFVEADHEAWKLVSPLQRNLLKWIGMIEVRTK